MMQEERDAREWWHGLTSEQRGAWIMAAKKLIEIYPDFDFDGIERFKLALQETEIEIISAIPEATQ